MPSHEHGLFLGNVHMNTPELVEEFLVSGHQIGKCLRQRPRCRKRYPNRSAVNGSGPCQEGELTTTFIAILCPRSKKINQLAYLWF